MSFDSFFSSSMFSSRLVHAITMKVRFIKLFIPGSCGFSSDEGTMETMMNRGSFNYSVGFLFEMTRLAAWVTVKEKRHGQRSCWEQQDTDHASSKRIKPVNR
ncbi:unnamed protein product [Brassica rapa]|uniref:Uncharacterized protein n=1 Tax=Brassica campestris TaxID=3711 RepID=A0A3P5Z7E6_BRACM|nr:unnamed protein product [Brassica rapa]VDC75937.1 unnamed protein product [Brassica rapa]